MTVEERNIDSMRRFYDEVMNQGNLAYIDESCSEDYIEHDDGPPIAGRDLLKQEVAMLRAAFPDLHVTVEDIVASGDRVAARTTLRCTHRGAFMGLAPTGNALEIGGMDIVRFVDGKSAEHWGLHDNLQMMKQLGMIPAGPPH